MTASVTTAPLTIEAARVLTDEVKADAAALWAKLLRLYEGEAHVALGYGSWGEYYEEEFGESKSRGYQLLEAARVQGALSDSTIVERPATESIARELVPVLRDEPEQVAEVWGEVVELHGRAPTAREVRSVVRHRRGPTEAVAAVGRDITQRNLTRREQERLQELYSITSTSRALRAADPQTIVVDGVMDLLRLHGLMKRAESDLRRFRKAVEAALQDETERRPA